MPKVSKFRSKKEWFYPQGAQCQTGIQRYKCSKCGHNFSSIRRPKKLSKKLFKEYLQGKQTLNQLALKYDRSIPWIKKQLDAYEPEARAIIPSIVTLVADATFFGRRSDKFGTLVFKDVLADKIVACKHIESETVND